MKKLALILAVAMMVTFAGCTSNDNPTIDNQNEVSIENVIQKDMKKFLHKISKKFLFKSKLITA